MLPNTTVEGLARLADEINHVSRLVAEADDWAKPSGGDWAPWIKPFEGNFPRVMPRISQWVDEARQFIDEGRPGGIYECPFEFSLTDCWTGSGHLSMECSCHLHRRTSSSAIRCPARLATRSSTNISSTQCVPASLHGVASRIETAFGTSR